MFFAGKFVLDLSDFAECQGLAKSEIIGISGFNEEQLDEDGFLVSYDCIASIFQAIKEHLPDHSFGLHMGEQITLKATGYIDQMMDSCATVQDAFECAVTYSKLISDSMECTLEVYDNRFRVNFELNPDWALQNDYAVNQNLDLALLCAKNSLQRLTSKSYFPTEVNFHYPKPQKISEHYRLFNTHLNFKTPVSSIVFNKHILHQPTRGKNEGLFEELVFGANEVLASLPDQSEIISLVKKALLKSIRPGLPSILEVAEALHMTPRTLQRKLKAEHTTFKKTRNEIRLQLIKKINSSGRYNLDELAYLTGYTDSSSLARAFKSWTGSSVRKFSQS